MQKTNVNKESMDVREVLDFFMRMPHKHSIWLWISWTTVSPLHCPVFSVGSPWNWFCEVEFYLFLDAADGIRDMFWIGCLPENKFVLLRPWSTLPTQWSEWIFPSVFLLATPVGLRNLQVCNFWNIFVSGVTFCFSCSQGSAFLPTAAAFFWSSLTLEGASSILSLVTQAFSLALQLWESVPSYSAEYTWSNVFGSWVLLDGIHI